MLEFKRARQCFDRAPKRAASVEPPPATSERRWAVRRRRAKWTLCLNSIVSEAVRARLRVHTKKRLYQDSRFLVAARNGAERENTWKRGCVQRFRVCMRKSDYTSIVAF